MNNGLRSAAVITFLCIAALATPMWATAQDWTGQGEAGLVKTSGNTDSENFNIGLAFIKDGEVWSHGINTKYFKSSTRIMH